MKTEIEPQPLKAFVCRTLFIPQIENVHKRNINKILLTQVNILIECSMWKWRKSNFVIVYAQALLNRRNQSTNIFSLAGVLLYETSHRAFTNNVYVVINFVYNHSLFFASVSRNIAPFYVLSIQPWTKKNDGEDNEELIISGPAHPEHQSE